MTGVETALQQIAETAGSTSPALLAHLVRVVRPRRREDERAAAGRVRDLVGTLARRRDYARALACHLEAVLTARYQRFAFAEAGVLADEGFVAGLARRLAGRVRAGERDGRLVAEFVSAIFDRPDDHVWLAAVPDETWDELRAALVRVESRQPMLRRHVQREMLEALRMLSQRLATLGLAPEFVRRSPSLAGHESPFLAQNEETVAFVYAVRMAIVDPQAPYPDGRRVRLVLERCLSRAEGVRRDARGAGSGVRLVRLLAQVEQVVARMSLLTRLVVPDGEVAGDLAREHSRLLIGIVRAENRRHRVGDHVREHARLLAGQALRRVRERSAGVAGRA